MTKMIKNARKITIREFGLNGTVKTKSLPCSLSDRFRFLSQGLTLADLTSDDDDFIPRNTPPLTQHTATKRPAAPTHECTGPAGTGPRRIATEKKGRVSGTATG